MFLLKNGWKICKIKKNYLPLHPLTSKRSGFSAVGSAHVWGARGRWFESSNPDQKEACQQTYPLFLFYEMKYRLNRRDYPCSDRA